jgi:hypothetical protein
MRPNSAESSPALAAGTILPVSGAMPFGYGRAPQPSPPVGVT